MNQKGVIALAAPLLILLIIAVILATAYSLGFIKISSLPKLPGQKKEPTVSLQKQYQNPFDKNSQFVNPFSSYKNPFDELK